MDQAALYLFLLRQRYGVISSLSPEGTPHSALVGIAVTPDLEIIFDTVKSSRKYPNLVARPACSLVAGWTEEKTLQMEGDARTPSGSELTRYQEIYFTKWPDGRSRMHSPDIAYLVVTPRWMRYSDYAQTPPLIEEFVLPQKFSP